MALWLWRRFKHGHPSCRTDNNRLNRHSISMQNLSEWRFNQVKWWNTRVQDVNQNNGCKTKGVWWLWSGPQRQIQKRTDTYGWVNRKTFEGHVQDVVLKVRTKDGKVMSKDGLQLPCSLEAFVCDTLSFDPYAYIWVAPDNCVLANNQKADVNMIKQGKKLLCSQWTEQHQSVFIRRISGTPEFPLQTSTSIPDQLRFVLRGYRLRWIWPGFYVKSGIHRRKTAPTILPTISVFWRQATCTQTWVTLCRLP